MHDTKQRFVGVFVFSRVCDFVSCFTITLTLASGCEKVMAALEECHAQGFLHKMIGGCNDAKRDVNLCLRAERLERSAKNREKSKEKNERVKRIWREIDEES